MRKKCRKVISMPVVSLGDGSQVGRVKGLLVDPAGLLVVALVLDQKGLFKEPRVIPYNRVKSFGEHAITIERGSSVERAASVPQLAKLYKEPCALVGAQVITEEGNVLGVVDEYFFDSATGVISSLELTGKFRVLQDRASLPAQTVVTVGRAVIIARAGAEQELESTERPFRETIKTVKNTSVRAWNSTVNTTRRLGTSLSKSVEKLMADETNPLSEKADASNDHAVRTEPPVANAPEVTEITQPDPTEEVDAVEKKNAAV